MPKLHLKKVKNVAVFTGSIVLGYILLYSTLRMYTQDIADKQYASQAASTGLGAMLVAVVLFVLFINWLATNNWRVAFGAVGILVFFYMLGVLDFLF